MKKPDDSSSTNENYLITNRITIEGKDYYLVKDFEKATGIDKSSIYQMIYRNTIPENRWKKIHGVLFISAIELEERSIRKSRLEKIKDILDTKKSIEGLSNEDLGKLTDLLSRK